MPETLMQWAPWTKASARAEIWEQIYSISFRESSRASTTVLYPRSSR